MPKKSISEIKAPRRPPRRKADPPESASASGQSPEIASLDPEEVTRLAHAYWLERGGEGGSAEDDWLRAERELRARQAAGKEKPMAVRRRAAP
jgi:hypothetical protein